MVPPSHSHSVASGHLHRADGRLGDALTNSVREQRSAAPYAQHDLRHRFPLGVKDAPLGTHDLGPARLPVDPGCAASLHMATMKLTSTHGGMLLLEPVLPWVWV